MYSRMMQPAECQLQKIDLMIYTGVDQPNRIWVDPPNRPGFAAPESRFCRLQIGGPRTEIGLYYERVISSSIYNGLHCRHQLSPLAPSNMVHFVTSRFHLIRGSITKLAEGYPCQSLFPQYKNICIMYTVLVV